MRWAALRAFCRGLTRYLALAQAGRVGDTMAMKNLANRRVITGLGALALTVGLAGAAFADKAPPPRPTPTVKPAGDADAKGPSDTAPTPVDGAAAPVEKPPEVRRIKDTRPQRLPDGVFIGRLDGVQGGELRVTIVAGRVTEAFMRRPGGLALFDLWPVESGDSIEIRLQGSTGSEFVRINGAFFDAERGAGRFDGVLGRVKTSGTWLLARR